jgi:hypothetical protein
VSRTPGASLVSASGYLYQKMTLLEVSFGGRVCMQVDELVEALVERLCATQVPPLKKAAELMTPLTRLVVADERLTIQQAAELLSRCPSTVLPVVRTRPLEGNPPSLVHRRCSDCGGGVNWVCWTYVRGWDTADIAHGAHTHCKTSCGRNRRNDNAMRPRDRHMTGAPGRSAGGRAVRERL